MLSTLAFLNICQKLAEAGLLCPWECGTRVARGFADLGIVEFQVISEDRKIVSMLTGQTSRADPAHEKFFFWVPDCDELVEELLRRRVIVESLRLIDQRQWQMVYQFQEKQQIVEQRELNQLLGEVLLKVLQEQVFGD